MEKAAKGRELQGIEPDLIRALSHPLRVRILVALSERVASPKDLELILGGGAKLSSLSYHCRQLLRYRCVEVVREEKIRGAMKTYYRATTRLLLDDHAWEKLPSLVKSGLSVAAIKAIVDRAHEAVVAQTFDSRTDRHAITITYDVDELAWDTSSKIVADAYRQLAAVEEEAANREGAKFRMTVSLLSYESPQASGA